MRREEGKEYLPGEFIYRDTGNGTVWYLGQLFYLWDTLEGKSEGKYGKNGICGGSL